MPTFVHGRRTDFLLNQYNLTRYFKLLRTKADVDLLDATTFGASAKEYQGGFFGGDVSGEGLFEATNALIVGANEVLDAALGAAVQPIGTIGPAGLDAVGSVCKLFQGDEQQHDVNSTIQNLVMITAQFLASEGVRRGVVLAPIGSYSPGGTAQVETATVVGTIDVAGAGDAEVIVTAAGMTNSPKAVSVAVANDDTDAQVATKIRAALALDADVSAFFTISGAGADVILTRRAAADNDATLNIAIDNDTCTGLTAAPTSADTTAGVAPAATPGASVDNGAATTNGAVAHLHVLSKSGTSPTVTWKVQHSADDSMWVDLMTFTAATDKTSQRLAVTGTVNRYLRASRIAGGSNSPSFEAALAIARL